MTRQLQRGGSVVLGGADNRDMHTPATLRGLLWASVQTFHTVTQFLSDALTSRPALHHTLNALLLLSKVKWSKGVSGVGARGEATNIWVQKMSY